MKPYVTAELGTNWKGDLDILEQMATACKDMGINAVKLQCLSPALLKRHIELDYYRESSVNEDNVKYIDAIMKSINIEWYASITYPEAVEIVKPYVSKYKIRAADCENKKLYNACCEACNVMKGDSLIISSVRPLNISYFSKWESVDVINLYCIPRYPTEFGEINFRMLTNPDFEGYSNHCRNPLAILKAARYGAKYIEFHLSHNREDFALDNPVSFSYQEAREIMSWLRK